MLKFKNIFLFLLLIHILYGCDFLGLTVEPVETETALSQDSSLEYLSIDNLDFSEQFNSSKYYYNCNVNSGTTEVNIKASVAHSGASILSGAGVHTIDFGENIIKIELVAENGISKSTYIINVYRNGEIIYNTQLSSLSLSNQILEPSFSSDVYEYTCYYDTSYTYTNINYVTESDDVYVEYTPFSYLQSLDQIIVDVKSYDEEAITTYTINLVQILQSDDATLSKIEPTIGELNTTFSSELLEYSVTVPYEITYIYLNTDTTHDDASLNQNSSTYYKSLSVGDNEVSITVTAADGVTTLTYKVNIMRDDLNLSSDATLSNIDLSTGELNVVFSPEILEYNVTIPYETSYIYLYPETSDDDASLDNNSLSYYKYLLVGDNEVNIIVTALDGETTITYTVNILRETLILSTDAALDGLTLSSGELNTIFSPDVLEYNVTVPYDDSSIYLYPVPRESNASLDKASYFIDLSVGDNEVTVIVTAQDEVSSLTYIVNINRGEYIPSSEARLSSISVGNSYSLTPGFNKDIYEYSIIVNDDIDSLNISGSVLDSTAQILYGTGLIDMAFGINIIDISVQAEDESEEIYHLSVERLKPEAGFNITFMAPEDESISYTMYGFNNLTNETALNITINQEYETYSWYIDNIKLENDTLNLLYDCSELALGRHMFLAVVTKDGLAYSIKNYFEISNN